jgi:ASC-1-like (ASCH) protein
MALIGVHDFFIKNNYILPELNNMEQAKSILDDVKNFYNKAKENKFLVMKISKILMKKLF